MFMSFKIAICQMGATANKLENIDKAEKMIREAKENGAEIVVLPEIFNSPYDNKAFPVYAEVFPGETSARMMNVAKELGIYLVAGSIPENDGGKIYNTSYFYNREGKMIARHRKMHLFDIDIKGGQYFKESDVLTPGDDFTVVDTDLGRIGLGICFDIRFPEYFRVMALEGAEVVILPAAFNMTTGPAHWELSARMRAVDNQVYMVCASPARNEDVGYVAYGNSIVTDPWGDVVSKAGIGEEILYADIDLDRVAQIREQLPLLKALRKDKYKLEYDI